MRVVSNTSPIFYLSTIGQLDSSDRIPCDAIPNRLVEWRQSRGDRAPSINPMLQAKPRFLSFDEYLSYDDGTDNLYELFNGELIEVPPESGFNVEIANFLFSIFLPLVGHRRLRGHGLELEVRGEPKNRYPDLTIIQEEHIQLLKKRNTIRLNMAPPLLVIEIVSPGELQRDRDYIAKRSQYQDLGIPEYWIIDPQEKTVLVLELTGATYREVNPFKENDWVRSPQLKDLTVTVEQIFEAADITE